MNTEVAASQTAVANDEISLVDLLRILIKRKNTLFTVFSMFVLGGIVAVFILPEQYQYTTTIEIGTTVVKEDIRFVDDPNTFVKEDIRLIDDPNNLLAKIQESYIPLALLHYREANPDIKKKYELNARISRNSEIIVLEGKGSEDEADDYKQLQNDVVNQIIKEHSHLVSFIQKENQIELEKIQNDVDSLEDQGKLLQAKYQRLGEHEKLLTRQIDKVRQLVNDGTINREEASKGVKDETRAMTLLIIDNRLQQNRQRMFDLEHRLTIALANEKDEIEKTLADTRRNIAEKKSELSKVKLRHENMRETRSISPPIQSLEPIERGKKIILFIVVLLGIFVALFAAFLHEFIVNNKAKMKKL